jgi:hypothetical protein
MKKIYMQVAIIAGLVSMYVMPVLACGGGGP